MIDILLATYNGEKYLESQLLSIIAQSYKNWRLIVHDDGSSDNTINLLQSYQKKDSRITVIEDDIRFGNAGANFLYLTQFSQAPYAIFCDQDDIWFDNKLELLVSKIQSIDSDIPTVVYSQSYLWKPLKGITGISGFSDYLPVKLSDILFNNAGIQGCTAIFNRPTTKILSKYHGKISMHDHVLNLIAASIGRGYCVKVPLMLYRQHDSNVTGQSIFNERKIKQFYLKAISKSPVVSTDHYKTIKDFYAQFNADIPKENHYLFQSYLDMINYSLIKKLKTILSNKFSCNNSRLQLIFKIISRKFI